MGNPHVVVIPYPAQGHVIPMMELSHCLVNRGYNVTFINSDYTHKRVMESFANGHEELRIRLISIPDGLGPKDDRNDLRRLTEGITTVMPGKLEEIIRKINATEDDEVVTCLIADGSMGWALKVAAKMGIRHRVFFWPAAVGLLASILAVPKLIEKGVIGFDGTPINNCEIQLSPTMPTMKATNLVWNCMGNSEMNKFAFQSITKLNEGLNLADHLICNSSYDLEPGASSLVPNILPIGPLLASSRLSSSSGHFWLEDSSCLNWLNQQPARSVIYVAFGSFTVFNHVQFQELAYGLELSGQRFLWVTRPDSTHPFPDGFLTRISSRGCMVGWAPQQKVLSHPSIACFLSHCGWNSTMEGVSNGVPFLCWPYFVDQFLDEDYICDIWEIGLRLKKDENGIILRKEISNKLKQLLNDLGIRTRALKHMEMIRKSLTNEGCSSKNFEDFAERIKK